ncbi:ubiquitin recognition factor in ER-associated degradation protein 1 [Brachypodium distachyon]|uniref:Uncharacterized protein n=1 Tax=Brachypodium distachyon TaxID=15368 RepID=A0A0Q3ME81_BRADI|nr:ubiquitin recognition factor in ER-associated degradation protein 1 [Brachypodium distachyon]KQK02670.1 hypothetical protein BRADI_2g02984v3 [Brachypodium distachyon]|eukprot:XP_024315635.1 ubiquitin recognition factor in ER-associated degradation protein 1 [Brachypodium distachyon]
MEMKRKEQDGADVDERWEAFLEAQQTGRFAQFYRCRPMSLLDKKNAEDYDQGNKVIMPQSALERLSSINVQFPMVFSIENEGGGERGRSHCGVHEFVAEEGFVHLPTQMMEQLGVAAGEGGLVMMRNAELPKATFLKLQPHSSAFLNIRDLKDLMSYNFGRYACVTEGDTIAVREKLHGLGGRGGGEAVYRFDVIEARPGGAVSTVETDCEVDFAVPLDYKEPVLATPVPVPAAEAAEGPRRFAGVGFRMDGKPVEQERAPAAPAKGDQGKRVLQFGGASAAAAGGAAAGGKKVGGGEEEEKKPAAARFTGKMYSLQSQSKD